MKLSNEISPHLSELFPTGTRAVLAKRRAKALSHVARDSNVTLLWSGERGGGGGRGEVGAALHGWFLILQF